MKRVKFFKYSDFGPVTCYLGPIGSGLTLGSVIHLVRSKASKIYSNIHLFHLPSQILDLAPIVENFYLSQDLTIFVDNTDIVTSSMQRLSKKSMLFSYLISMSRKLGIKFILNSHQFETLDSRIRDSITDIVQCKFIPRQRLLLKHSKLAYKTVWGLNEETGKGERCTKWFYKPVSECLLKRVGKYYKYFDTFEVVRIGKGEVRV